MEQNLRQESDKVLLTNECVTHGESSEIFALEDVAHFYTSWRRSLLGQAFAIVRNHALAEDLTQEAFVRLVTEVKSGSTVRSVAKWTSTVLRHLAFNQLGHSKVVNRVIEPNSQEFLDTIPEDTSSAEENYLARESRERLKNVLSQLTPLERECTLMFADGYSYNEIARKKKLSYGVAVDVVRRSLRKLRKQLQARRG